MKASIKNYYLPTPVLARRIGDGLLTLFIGVTPIVGSMPIDEPKKIWINIGLSICGLIAKFVTNLFKDESTTEADRV